MQTRAVYGIDCLRQPPSAGRGRARSACARGNTCACCPPALDLASSAAISNPPPKILARDGPEWSVEITGPTHWDQWP